MYEVCTTSVNQSQSRGESCTEVSYTMEVEMSIIMPTILIQSIYKGTLYINCVFVYDSFYSVGLTCQERSADLIPDLINGGRQKSRFGEWDRGPMAHF